MEIYSKTTRFALACNASDKIIGALEPISDPYKTKASIMTAAQLESYA